MKRINRETAKIPALQKLTHMLECTYLFLFRVYKHLQKNLQQGLSSKLLFMSFTFDAKPQCFTTLEYSSRQTKKIHKLMSYQ